MAHLYKLRRSAGYWDQREVPTKRVCIGVCRAPAPESRAGSIRIASVHQGDHNGINGTYHINAVDCVTQ